MVNKLKAVVDFYIQGFRSMDVGRKLWLIIGIKLFVMFAILKVFFFPNLLKENFKTDKERGEHVLEQLIDGSRGVKKSEEIKNTNRR